ncbi:DUF1707 SHOCT-like domain-containing protein [Pseudonocardia sp. TRM90224]|uniref:DUF1707 SHOCT-like domain-containing protein n=1 Tax=Pseudonocardia sp. TRM90224 TaxID=2812678 RepID=UPI001E3439B0|nr:DUF1707 domain-containing protein [Pseudonocardia sp. TRM90224]
MSDVEHGVMRASEADRAAVAERLRLAVDEGRLGLTEYDERLRATYASATYGELDRVTADLPALRPEQRPTAKEEKATAERKEWFDEWRSWLGGAVIMLAIWGGSSVVSAELQPFWPAIPLGIWAAILIASAIGGGGDCKKDSK